MFRDIASLRQKRANGQWDVGICETLYEFRGLGCENPRDRIYGFLGVLPEIHGLGVVPTYGGHVSAAQIYADFARRIIQDTGSLEILNCVRSGAGVADDMGDEMDHLPSWTPNWARWSVHDPAPLLKWSEVNATYNAAGSLMKARIRDDADPNTLVLSGIRFDVVAELGTPWHPLTKDPPVSRKGIQALEQWEDLALATPLTCPYGGAEGRREALWRSYIADSAAEGSAPEHYSAVAECWYDRVDWTSSLPSHGKVSPGDATTSSQVRYHPAWAKHMMQLLTEHGSTRNPLRAVTTSFQFVLHGAAEYGEYAQRVAAACAHRRLLVSKRGYIGLAPLNAETGDVIAVLYGGTTPFLLRPGALPGLYSFVGECFVHGIMGGESLQWQHAIAAARDFRIV